MNGLSTGMDADGVTLALKFDSSCVTASTPPSSTCKMTQMGSAHNNIKGYVESTYINIRI